MKKSINTPDDDVILNDGNTMYELCDIKTKCGKDLVCENNRCKQKEGGSCSSDNDCSNKMFCVNWVCTNDKKKDIKIKRPKKTNKKSVSFST